MLPAPTIEGMGILFFSLFFSNFLASFMIYFSFLIASCSNENLQTKLAGLFGLSLTSLTSMTKP